MARRHVGDARGVEQRQVRAVAQGLRGVRPRACRPRAPGRPGLRVVGRRVGSRRCGSGNPSMDGCWHQGVCAGAAVVPRVSRGRPRPLVPQEARPATVAGRCDQRRMRGPPMARIAPPPSATRDGARPAVPSAAARCRRVAAPDGRSRRGSRRWGGRPASATVDGVHAPERHRLLVLRRTHPARRRLALVRLPDDDHGVPRPLAVKRVTRPAPDGADGWWVERRQPPRGGRLVAGRAPSRTPRRPRRWSCCGSRASCGSRTGVAAGATAE